MAYSHYLLSSICLCEKKTRDQLNSIYARMKCITFRAKYLIGQTACGYDIRAACYVINSVRDTSWKDGQTDGGRHTINMVCDTLSTPGVYRRTVLYHKFGA